MIDIIRDAWGWTGLVPVRVVDSNPFGNLIVEAEDGRFWRICPEEWSCKPIAAHASELSDLYSTEEFRDDWEMSGLVELAADRLGPLSEGRCYCLKMPPVLGGKYRADNLGTISLAELIAFAGDMGLQIKDVPDGTPFELKIVNKPKIDG